MTIKNPLRTRFEWLDALSSMSAVAATLNLKSKVTDDIYKAAGQHYSSNKDAFNLANSEEHNRVVAATIDALSAKGADVPPETSSTHC